MFCILHGDIWCRHVNGYVHLHWQQMLLKQSGMHEVSL